jgi:hypothetical protein
LGGGGSGLADLWLQPFTLGWHLKRWDLQVGDAFMVPTGRYSPGASNNVGTGYFGIHLQAWAAYYITKNKGTSANVFTDWEVHGTREGTSSTHKTPGQGFTDEWGVGQMFPLKKDFSKLSQVGVVGCDQWQIAANGGQVPVGSTGVTLPASPLPYYSVHAVGGQFNYILPAKNFSVFFKYYHEFSVSSHTLGNTVVFGGAWTLADSQTKASGNIGAEVVSRDEVSEQRKVIHETTQKCIYIEFVEESGASFCGAGGIAAVQCAADGTRYAGWPGGNAGGDAGHPSGSGEHGCVEKRGAKSGG